jgi:hypothetical protein
MRNLKCRWQVLHALLLRVFSTYAIIKVSSSTQATKKLGRSYVPSLKTFLPLTPFRPLSVTFSPFHAPDRWAWSIKKSKMPFFFLPPLVLPNPHGPERRRRVDSGQGARRRAEQQPWPAGERRPRAWRGAAWGGARPGGDALGRAVVAVRAPVAAGQSPRAPAPVRGGG